MLLYKVLHMAGIVVAVFLVFAAAYIATSPPRK